MFRPQRASNIECHFVTCTNCDIKKSDNDTGTLLLKRRDADASQSVQSNDKEEKTTEKPETTTTEEATTTTKEDKVVTKVMSSNLD